MLYTVSHNKERLFGLPTHLCSVARGVFLSINRKNIIRKYRIIRLSIKLKSGAKPKAGRLLNWPKGLR
jgi:hypothetical protein